MQNLPVITIMKIPATLTFQSKIQQRISRPATACFPLIPVTGAEAKPEEDESEEDGRYWNIHMACIILEPGKPTLTPGRSATLLQRYQPCRAASRTASSPSPPSASSASSSSSSSWPRSSNSSADDDGILYEGCKIWYLIAGHSTFQVPTFSCPQHQQSIRYDAAELLHDWLCGAEDSAGEATARALALTLATAATSSSLAAAPPPRRHSSSLESPSLL